MPARVAALYDVHGNLPALEAVLAELDADVIVVGGDVAAGPWPAETLERARPTVIDGSRRQRIARGSGVGVDEVNRLMEGRKQMEKMMKMMSRGKMPNLGALAGAGAPSAAIADGAPRRKATKSNKRKKRSKSRR